MGHGRRTGAFKVLFVSTPSCAVIGCSLTWRAYSSRQNSTSSSIVHITSLFPWRTLLMVTSFLSIFRRHGRQLSIEGECIGKGLQFMQLFRQQSGRMLCRIEWRGAYHLQLSPMFCHVFSNQARSVVLSPVHYRAQKLHWSALVLYVLLIWVDVCLHPPPLLRHQGWGPGAGQKQQSGIKVGQHNSTQQRKWSDLNGNCN